MALEVVQPGVNPLGQFDGLDSVYLSVKGGEVASITSIALTSTDQAAADVFNDGYVGTTRPVVTTALVSGMRPLFLVDDGIAGYGTLFGTVVGGVAGRVTTGSQLGPHTAAASGKLTLWDKPGTYAITLDAVDPATDTGLQPQNATLTIGAKLYATSAGLLTPAVSYAFENVTVARFINFEYFKGGSLVNTPISLVSAKNSPSGPLGGTAQTLKFARALVYFHSLV